MGRFKISKIPKKVTQILILAIALLLISPIADAKQIAGITFPDSHELSRAKLVLNGVGIRKKLFLKLYVGGLYLKKKNQNPKEIIMADEAMAIRLHIVSSMITSQKMEKTTREGFEKSTDGKIEPIKSQIEEFISVFQEKIQENDIYDLIYNPGNGVEVYKNGKAHSVIEGLNFKQALFGIWLSDKPAQGSLKAVMLGM
jgi:hypothetical protein